MCYSAEVYQQYDKYANQYGAHISIEQFVRLYVARSTNPKIKTPRAMDAAFEHPTDADEEQIKTLIDVYRSEEVIRLEQELFKQRKRLADAERILLTKTTKAATESQRIATAKIDWALNKLADLRRTEPKASDSRIYPGYYAPVIVMEDGKRVIKPMRYQCRPEGKPAFYDTQYPGTYNARRNNLEGFWKKQFGYTHGLIVVNAFYEHVTRKVGDASENVILEFKPQPTQDMLVAGSVAIALLGRKETRCSSEFKTPGCRTDQRRTWVGHRGSATAPSSPCAWSRFRQSVSGHSKTI